ncbi:MAG: 6-pyruvoyl-tetrahydropterin synthase-related protein [Candidatus Aenigmatarchaeota archaeon]
MKRINTETILDFLILLAITLFLFSYFKPSLLFSNTEISAGDTVGHFFGTYYMNKYLIPHGKLIGWCQEWFLGYPAFQFYFPLVFFITGLLAYFIPIFISFKIGSVLGVFLLPICTYFCFKLMRFKFPVPSIAATLTLILLFLERVSKDQIYSMWGGNIPSVLAGELSYNFSLCLAVLFMGILYRVVEEKKNVIKGAIVFSLVVLSHAIVAIFTGLVSSFYLLSKKNFFRNFIQLLKVFGLAFMLAAFWIVPMVFKTKYTVPHVWGFPGRKSELIAMLSPEPIRFIYIAAIIVIFVAIIKKEKRCLFFAYSAFLASFFFLISPTLNEMHFPGFEHLQLIKFLPFLYLSVILTAASGFSFITDNLNGKWIVAIIVLLLSIYWVNENETYISHWIKWNYEGYEGKRLYMDYKKANEFLSTTKKGRIAFEYDPQKYDQGLGSSRATETIPNFSGRPITEGTHFQSAFSGPYIYNAHCEYSSGCSCLFGPITNGCPSFNFDRGTKHLEMFNVKYFFVSSDKVKNILRNRTDYKMVYGPAEFEIWELLTHSGNYVVVPDYEPVVVKSKNWRELSYQWFENDEKMDVPLVWVKEINEVEKKRFIKSLAEPSLPEIPKVKLENSECFINNEVIEEERVSFDTNCIGKPHIIKISYFPNWKVKGADKIYMVSPTFMMVFPEKEHVELYYGKTFPDILGTILSFTGIIIVIFWKKVEGFIDGFQKKGKDKSR